MIDAAKWTRLWNAFDRAIVLPVTERTQFIANELADDPALSDHVLRLVVAHDRAESSSVPFTAAIDGEIETTVNTNGSATAIGPYRIKRIIGVGGMGTVYEAEQESPRRIVAVKILNVTRLTPEMRQRFEREAAILARLRHPGIAHVYSSGVTDLGEGGRPYFSMEFIRGEPITKWCADRVLGTRDRLRLFHDVCKAIQYAHEHGIIHRDLKPDNILVDEHGQPKVLDFGVARVTNCDMDPTSIATTAGQIIGTIPYMSPEQITGSSQDVDEQSDVYALGVLLFQLLAGVLPLDLADRSLAEAARIVRDVEPTRLRSIDRRWRGDLESIAAKAMEKEKGARYPDVEKLAGDVDRYLNDLPIWARPQTKRGQVRKFARRNKAIVGGVVATILALSVGTGIATWQAVRATNAQQLSDMRFNEVRQLARAVIFDLEESIRNLPGSLPAQRLLVETALEYLERLRVEAGNDSGLMLEVAEAYAKIARVQGYPQNPNLGELEAAADTYQLVLPMATRLYEADPVNERAARLYARVLYESALLADGPDDDAAFQKANDVLQPFLTRSSSIALHCDYAELLTYWSLCRFDLSSLTDAFEIITVALEDLEALRSEFPDQAIIDRQLADSLYWLAAGYALADEPAPSLAYAERAHPILTSVVEDNPADTFLRERLAMLESTLAWSLMRTGRVEEGVQVGERALATLEELTEADPQNFRPLRQWSVACAHFAHGQLSAARQTDRSIEQRIESCTGAILWAERALELFRTRQQRGWLQQEEVDSYFQKGQSLANEARRELAELRALPADPSP